MRVVINNRFCFSTEAERFKVEHRDSADPLMNIVFLALFEAEKREAFHYFEVSPAKYKTLCREFRYVDAAGICHPILRPLKSQALL